MQYNIAKLYSGQSQALNSIECHHIGVWASILHSSCLLASPSVTLSNEDFLILLMRLSRTLRESH